MVFLSLFVDMQMRSYQSAQWEGSAEQTGGVWIPTVFDIQQIKKKLNDI